MSAAIHNVTANPRNEHGKGAARRLRNGGQIPAVAYGKGLKATPLAVMPKEILTVLKSERGQNTVLKMAVAGGGSDMLVMIKEFTYHPVTRSLEHVDFVQVQLDKPVDVDVPLQVNGKAVGITNGGVLRQVFRTLPVRCLPDRIPLKLECDVTSLDLHEAIHTKEIKVPEGVEIRLPEEQTLVAIVAPEKDRSAEDDAAAAAAGAAVGATSAAAPAAAPAAAGGKPAAGAAAAPAKDAGKDAKKK
jgi:large subunit ribosomal protein L25